MRQGRFIEEEKLLQQSINILMEKLGPVETSRFLSFPSQKRIESVKRHKKWQAGLHMDKFFNDVFGRK
jgi:hypothetical protein